jgi:hypothetical protein
MRQLAVIALAFLTMSGVAQAQNLGGTYRVEGQNLNGTPYTGTATIRFTSNTTCVIRWNTGGGSSTQDGICMWQGDILVAGYVFRGGESGLVMYRHQGNGVLDGIWTVTGANGSGRERLVPAR